jgi:putative restriction endonuclease
MISSGACRRSRRGWRGANHRATTTVDHLFGRGFISFECNGRLIVSPVAHAESLRRMGVDPAVPISVGAFSEGQRRYLEYHRENVLRLAVVRR